MNMNSIVDITAYFPLASIGVVCFYIGIKIIKLKTEWLPSAF